MMWIENRQGVVKQLVNGRRIVMDGEFQHSGSAIRSVVS